jgi:hypothetical protein
MKLHSIFTSSTILIIAQFALASFTLADEPARPNGQALGTMEAILHKCADVDPKAAEQYRQQAQLITHGSSEKVVAEVRNSDEYKQSYDSTAESLSQLSDHDALQGCSRSLAAK